MHSRYLRQLDGLRALAVLLVVFHHFAPERWHALVSWGRLGVDIFFVISGFLITRILLNGRPAAPGTPVHRLYFMRQFYIRRFLRIAPLYYATILAAVAMGVLAVNRGLVWHSAYLSNVYFVLRGSYDGATAHFWSLAVEEHFYLLWPWIILFTPRRWLGRALGAVIAAGVLFRAAGAVFGWNALATDILVPGGFETLGLGAFLAWTESRGVAHRDAAWLKRAGIAGLALDGLILTLTMFHRAAWFGLLFTELARGLMFVWLVAAGAGGFQGWLGRGLGSRPAVKLGKLSYGIYLLHNFVLCRVPDGPHPWVRPVVAFGGTILLAALAHRFIERPFRELKRYFPYRSPEAPPILVAETAPATALSIAPPV